MKTTRVVCGAAVVLMLAGAVGPSCTTNPATGRSQFNALSPDQEVQMGMEAAPQLTQEMGGKVPDAQLQDYVTRIGRSLATVTEAENPKLPWEFTLLNSDVINAFALPGGKVFISLGLAQRMSNEAQMAAVLGHECGHVTARHINDQMARQGLTSIIVGVGSEVVGAKTGMSADTVGQLGQQIGGVVLLKYSRKQELEADALGVRYMTRLHYNPIGARQVMEILLAASQGSRPPAFLSTHPYPEDRIKQIDQMLATPQYAPTQNNPQYVLKESEFRSQFLSRASGIHPPPSKSGALMKGDAEGRVFALGAPEAWCAVCAAAARAEAEQGR